MINTPGNTPLILRMRIQAIYPTLIILLVAANKSTLDDIASMSELTSLACAYNGLQEGRGYRMNGADVSIHSEGTTEVATSSTERI